MAAEVGQFSIRQLQPQDLLDVKRLHKYAMQAGRPVFAQYGDDAASVLEAAAAGVAGTFGFAVFAADPGEPGDEAELVAALTAQAEQQQQQQQQQQQGGADLVLLTLVVRADVRQQGVGRMLLQALAQHAAQRRAQGQPCVRLVADIALSNSQAWHFFSAMGFTRGAVSGQTAEAWLALQPGGQHTRAGSALPPAAAALSARHAVSSHSSGSSTGCSSSAMVWWRRTAALHVPRPLALHTRLHGAASLRMPHSRGYGCVRPGLC